MEVSFVKIAVIGTGYVGLVTGVCLSEIGHEVTCIDIDSIKINKLKNGISTIYEEGLEKLMEKNIENHRLSFTTSYQEGLLNADVIYIAVGTPENNDGSANLSYVFQVGKDIAKNIVKDVVVVTKSTVPVGTNDRIKGVIVKNLVHEVKVDIVSNPEFLREGSAIYDSFNGDRIVIGAENKEAADILTEINKPYNIPIFKTDVRSAEMIKYASNAFLATKISFINEISNICERIGANVEDVALGMGQDSRIGTQFLNAGIGYGGSCFPKDTKALVQIAGNVEYDFELLKGVIHVNQKQQKILLNKLYNRIDSLNGKKIAILGLTFKPNTDDIREAASIPIVDELINKGAKVIGYDPKVINNNNNYFNKSLEYGSNLLETLKEAEAVLILTEWEEFKDMDLSIFEKYMKNPLVFDGRNCFKLEEVVKFKLEYHSMGRPVINKKGILENA